MLGTIQNVTPCDSEMLAAHQFLLNNILNSLDGNTVASARLSLHLLNN